MKDYEGNVIVKPEYDFLRTCYVYVDDLVMMPVIAEKDGKLYGYDFEIIENNNDNIIKNGQKENTSKYRLKNWLIDRCIAFHRDAFHHDEKTLDEMKVDLEKRDLEDVMYYYDFLVGSIEHALYEYADEKIYEKCID